MRNYLMFIILIISVSCQQKYSKLEELYFSKRYDQTIKAAKEILSDNPNHIEANTFLGESLVHKREYKLSLPYLNKAIKLENKNLARKLWVTYYKAIALYSLDNYSEAQKCITKCYELNSTPYGMKEVNNFSMGVGFKEIYPNWEIIESEHFRFHFPPKSNVIEKKLFIKKYEFAFKNINIFFKSVLPKRIEIIIWNSDEDSRKIGIKNLAFANCELMFIHTNKNHTVGHEMTHIISYYCSSQPKILNKFVSEGTAVCFDQTSESKLGRARYQRDKEKYTKKIVLSEVWKKPDNYPDWMVYFLGSEVMEKLIMKYGREKYLKLYHNQSYNSAKLIYGNELDKVLSEVENDIN